MDLGLKDKVALVAAASKGLGFAVAKELVREGARVVIASRDASRIQKAAEIIEQETGKSVFPLTADVGRAEEIKALLDEIGKRYGRLDVLITNAGGPPSGKFQDFDDGDWEDAFVRNFLSVVRLIRGSLPWMSEGGRVVALASSSVRQPIPGLILSNTMRAGVAALIKTLAEELAGQGILLNTVCPGRIATDRLIELDSIRAQNLGLSLEEVRKEAEAAIPLKRYGDPEEFARAVVFLASWANTYITGQVLLVDGGLVRAL
ncbi:MAG: 3-oxoacyl-ACP reductase [Bacillus thermozeamaize]|jgi:3-oxoacyl-[acyl-carrier protein] reductase|uniref:3-oxoacyl-ACP reductase n=1 Tax=Bacillus thermozeamaize TaxID=230954 RepID=A0A1Y3PDR4_9BACI|nr:MAG: 3-oxoacyl-ACP reductase [Bacillus thermozeamaize]